MYTVKKLLASYLETKELDKAMKITFTGVGDRDVYNITAPFEDNGKLVIAGRVEARDTEHSEVIFFTEAEGRWTPLEGMGTYELQDPFVSFIGGQLIFGGVEIFPHPENEGALSWRTAFYKGADLHHLKRFAIGPDGMKDIRLIQLDDGRIGVFTRPQGTKGGRGKIGYITIDHLDELRPERIEAAPLIQDHFIQEEWGGANEIHLLPNGKIGVLGHIASFDPEGDRHYYPMTFLYDPKTNVITQMDIIATRADFPEGPAKRADLKDVLFSGGLLRFENGQAELYVGVSDAEAHKVRLPDPFVKYEETEKTGTFN